MATFNKDFMWFDFVKTLKKKKSLCSFFLSPPLHQLCGFPSFFSSSFLDIFTFRFWFQNLSNSSSDQFWPVLTGYSSIAPFCLLYIYTTECGNRGDRNRGKERALGEICWCLAHRYLFFGSKHRDWSIKCSFRKPPDRHLSHDQTHL